MAQLGADGVTSDAYDRSMETVVERIGVNHEHNIPSGRDKATKEACDKLGWHVDSMPRNVRGCKEEVCRNCHYGCQIGAKQSTMKTWLQDAYEAGARILVRTRATKVTQANGAANGVEAQTVDGHRVTVRSKAVVASAGALRHRCCSSAPASATRTSASTSSSIR